MKRIIRNLEGQPFGYWTVIDRAVDGYSYDGYVKSYWNCKCRCGTEKRIAEVSLSNGHSTSCGCKGNAKTIARSTTHGMSGSREHSSWSSMRNRCLCPTHPDWEYYGGRGITISPIFDDFMEFYKELGTRPPNTTLDRIDNDKGYEPGNVRWSTQEVQVNNSRKARKITFNGKTQGVSEWARELGIPRPTISDRMNEGGLTGEQALALGRRTNAEANKKYRKIDGNTAMLIMESTGSCASVGSKFGVTANIISLMRRGLHYSTTSNTSVCDLKNPCVTTEIDILGNTSD